MQHITLFISIILCCTCIKQVFSDTPANCTYEDVIGQWKISLSLGKTQSSVVESNYMPSSFVVTFQPFNTVIDEFGNIGQWTLIYNQGFEATIAGRKYFGFFRYIQNGTTVTSICNSTSPMVTYNVLNGNKMFWYGDKIETQGLVKSHIMHDNAATVEQQIYKPNHNFIQEINTVQPFWKAKHYSHYEGMTIGDLNRMRGGQKSRILSRPKPARLTKSVYNMVEKMPKSFDWRNINGVNYVSPVKNQGSCGSCFAFSSTGMIEARLRIMTNNTVTDLLSEQDVVDCSPYSQGCDGGFPYLIAGKYAETDGLLLDQCKPYTGLPSSCTDRKCNTRYHATNYQYVGGFYGACNSHLMQLALVKNGPLSVSFEVYDDFMNYAGGIYVHTGLSDKFNPFELTNHAVLLVGYGVDEATGIKFWIVKNSWGKTWGESGYFRILRDADEVAIESIAVESFPIPI